MGHRGFGVCPKGVWVSEGLPRQMRGSGNESVPPLWCAACAIRSRKTRARCKEIPTRTTIKIAARPGCSYRSPAGRDERRGRRAPGPGFEKSSAVVTQGGRSFGPHSSCLKEDDRRHAGRTCRSVFSTSKNAKVLAWTGSAQIPPDPGQIYFCLNKQRHAGPRQEQ